MLFKCYKKKTTFSGRIVVGTLTGDDMGVEVWEANQDSPSISSLNFVFNALMSVSHVRFCVKFSVIFIHSGDFFRKWPSVLFGANLCI